METLLKELARKGWDKKSKDEFEWLTKVFNNIKV